MKKILEYIVFTFCLVCISSFPNNVFGQEEINVTGKIIEIAADEHIIQVNDRNFVVTAVFVDDGLAADPVPCSFNDLKVGSVVELHVEGKYNGFRRAKEVILFTGDKEKEILNNFE